MSDSLKLMAILAHPDDESLGMGGTLAKYSNEGVECCLVTATRGERGRYGDLPERPSLAEVGRMREAELRCAVGKLGVKQLAFLDYIDGDLDKADPGEAVARIAAHIRSFRPHVVLTFGPEGGYGHPDHIAISQFAMSAVVAATDSQKAFHLNGQQALPAHAVSKLYYMAWTKPKMDGYQAAFKVLKSTVDGVDRMASPAPDWLPNSRIDTSAYWEQVWDAVQCHKTQLAIYAKLHHLPEDHHRAIWGTQEFYRVFSTVNGGRKVETDLFEGLR